MTAHGRPVAALRRHLQPGRRLLVLTADGAAPGEIGRCLADAGYGASRTVVLEELGGPRRAPGRGHGGESGRAIASPTSTSWPSSSSPTQGRQPLPGVPGLPDEAFDHDGQLTKAEVRAVTLAALAPLRRRAAVGRGRRCRQRRDRVAALGPSDAGDRDRARRAARPRIAANAERLGVPELVVRAGEAPSALERPARARSDLRRRRCGRAWAARVLLGSARPRRAAGRQRRHPGRRGGAAGVPCRAWRTAAAAGARPRRAGRRPARLAAGPARHPARDPQVMRRGKLIGLGVGPGDPELLTVKAVRALERGTGDRLHRRRRPRQPGARDRAAPYPAGHARADRGDADDPGRRGHRPRLRPAHDRHRQRARPGPRRGLPVRGRPAALRLVRPPAAAARQPLRVRGDPRHHLDHAPPRPWRRSRWASTTSRSR